MTSDRAVLLMKMMSNNIRLGILRELNKQPETCVGMLEDALEISQSSASQHLAHLRNSGILTCKKEGKKVCYKIVDEDVKKILSSLDIND